jgi:sulfur-carrier protein adenylyltransferase/sulfurtransferase
MVSVPDIGPRELKRRLDAGEALTVLDVREPWEIKLASLPGTLNIPLNEVPARLGELNPHAELVVMCHAGGRSRRAAEFLSARGFTHVANLAGGIDAWSRDIDPDLPTY